MKSPQLLFGRIFFKRNKVVFIDPDCAYEACTCGKHHRSSFPEKGEHSPSCGDIIHADVCGSMQVSSRYFLLLEDDFSHYRFIYCIKQKFELFWNFQTS